MRAARKAKMRTVVLQFRLPPALADALYVKADAEGRGNFRLTAALILAEALGVDRQIVLNEADPFTWEEKHKANMAVNCAVRRGEMPWPRELPCFRCGNAASQYHHQRLLRAPPARRCPCLLGLSWRRMGR